MRLKLLALLLVSFFTVTLYAGGHHGRKATNANCTVNVNASLTTIEPGDSTNIFVTLDSVGTSSSTPSFTVAWLPSSSVTSPDSSNTYAHPTANTTYTVIVSNAYCGTMVDSITITMGCTLFAFTNNTSYYCPALGGTASVTTFDGVPPYTYTWSKGQTTSSVSGLAAGSYTVTVKDSNGCISPASFTVFPGSLISSAVASSNTIEVGDSTFLTAELLDSASNSSVSASYTVTWLPSSSVTYKDSVSTYVHPNTTTTYTATVVTPCKTFTDTVTVFIGCTTTDFITPLQYYFCPAIKGAALVTAMNGIAPYTYAWSNGNTTDSITGLIPGTYSVTVQDFQGCSYVDSVTIFQDQPAIGIQVGATSINAGDSVSLYTYLSDSLAGSLFPGPYTIKWIPSANVTSPDSAFTYAHPNITTTYTAVVTDACNTESDTATVQVIVAGINGITAPVNAMTVSPNPANGLFNLSYVLNKDENVNLSVIDEFGRIVYEKQVYGHSGISKQLIDISNLPEGIYSLRLVTNEGVMAKKIIVVKN